MLKWYLIIAAVIFAGYQWKQGQDKAGPEPISEPVYVEYRMDLNADGRILNAVLFGKMASRQECELQADEFWHRTLKDCAICEFKSSSCQKQLPARYSGIFDNKPLNTSYVSFTSQHRDERDGRMILWGMNDREAELVCDIIRRGVDAYYRGDVRCVVGGG